MKYCDNINCNYVVRGDRPSKDELDAIDELFDCLRTIVALQGEFGDLDESKLVDSSTPRGRAMNITVNRAYEIVEGISNPVCVLAPFINVMLDQRKRPTP